MTISHRKNFRRGTKNIDWELFVTGSEQIHLVYFVHIDTNQSREGTQRLRRLRISRSRNLWYYLQSFQTITREDIGSLYEGLIIHNNLS